MSSAPGSIPQSTALAEATASSISDLMSRDPAGLSRSDRDKLVGLLREQRARWEAGEKGPGARGAAKAKGAKEPKVAKDMGEFSF